MNKKFNKLLGIILSFSVVFCSCRIEVLASDYGDRTEEFTISDHGEKYEIEVETKGNHRTVVAVNEENKDVYIISVSDDEIVVESKEYIGKSYFGRDRYSLNTKKIEREDSESVEAVASGYKSKVTTVGSNNNGNKYWYALGTGSDAKYLKIGCVAKYRVKNTVTDVDKYVTSVNAAKKYFLSASAETAVGVICDGIALLAELLSCGIATGVAIALLSAAIACATATATAIFNFNENIDNAAFYYNKIKVHGKKL